MTALQSVLMPKLGLTMTEGTLAEWKVAPGDPVAAGDVIFVVETDKISNEIEAQQDGVVAALHAEPGDVLPVGAIVASLRIGNGGEGEVIGLPPEPAAIVEELSAPTSAASERAAGGRIVATPLARRLAARAGIDLAAVSGSGVRGRIVADDVTALLDVPVVREVAEEPVSTIAPGAGTVRELGAYQRVAARRLSEAKRDIPHFYVFARADVTDLLVLREQLNAGGGQAKLTVSHFLIAAVARTLAAMPPMNCVWAGDSLRDLATVDVGLAVEGPKGLVAPVLRDLGGKTLDEIAKVAGALVDRARAGRLTSDDLQGGAIAISNVGMFGASALLPIINPGQSSILGVGASQPVFRPDAAGHPVLRHELELALSCDHRVIDGALAARFLQSVCRQLQSAAGLLRRPIQDSRQ